jgi:hypothetical protein
MSGVAGAPSLLGSGVVAAQLWAGEDSSVDRPETRFALDLVAGSRLAFQNRGEYELQGVPDRWRQYRLVT